MSVDIYVPLIFRELFNNKKVIKSEPGKLIDILNDIFGEHEELKEKFFDKKGDLKGFIKIFVDGKGINQLGGLNTYITDKQKVIIYTVMSGG